MQKAINKHVPAQLWADAEDMMIKTNNYSNATQFLIEAIRNEIDRALGVFELRKRLLSGEIEYTFGNPIENQERRDILEMD